MEMKSDPSKKRSRKSEFVDLAPQMLEHGNMIEYKYIIVTNENVHSSYYQPLNSHRNNKVSKDVLDQTLSINSLSVFNASSNTSF